MTSPTPPNGTDHQHEKPEQGARCPFDDPTFNMDPGDPCPVCGMTGFPGEEDKCVDHAEGSKP